MESRNRNLVGGDINGGAADLWQLMARPTLSWCPYRTPIRDVYLCSASAPPGRRSSWHVRLTCRKRSAARSLTGHLTPHAAAKHLCMPELETIERAREDAREGKSPSTQAGEFVREEMEHIREGKHGARSAKQAIAIGLSKARRAGVPLPPPKKGTTSRRTRRQAKRDSAKGRRGTRKPNPKRSHAAKRALKKEPHSAASHRALSRQAHAAARKRTAASRSRAAKKAARTRRKRR